MFKNNELKQTRYEQIKSFVRSVAFMEFASIVYGAFLIDDTGRCQVGVAQDVEQPLVEIAQAIEHACAVLPVQPPGDGQRVEQHLAAVADIEECPLAHQHARMGGAGRLGRRVVVLDDGQPIEVAVQPQRLGIVQKYLLLAAQKTLSAQPKVLVEL